MAQNYREPEIVFEGWTAPEGTGIIVTGAASGIGAATAILAAKSGLKVAAWDMFAEGIQETIERAGAASPTVRRRSQALVLRRSHRSSSLSHAAVPSRLTGVTRLPANPASATIN